MFPTKWLKLKLFKAILLYLLTPCFGFLKVTKQNMAMKVCLSKQMYENSWLVMIILRINAILPLTMKKDGLGIYLKLSPWHIFYSYILGIVILAIACYTQLYDIFLTKDKPTFIQSNIDGFLRFLAISANFLSVFCGIFIMPWKVLEFFDYIKCIEQVDSVIKTKYTKLDKYKSIIMLVMLLMCLVTIDALRLYADTKTSKQGVMLRKFIWNLAYWLIYIICLVQKYTNRHMAYSLEKRIARLNQILEILYQKHKRPGKYVCIVKNAWRYRTEDEIRSNQDEEHLEWVQNQDLAISQLSNSYLKLMDAAELFNNLFGLHNLIAVLIAVSHLVSCKYFIVLLLGNKRKGVMELTLRVSSLFLQIIKLLLIVEPLHACMGRLETVKNRVCKLLSLNSAAQYRKQVHAFAMTLCLRPFKFSACGLFDIDRFLYTSLFELVVTFLVISLQAEEH